VSAEHGSPAVDEVRAANQRVHGALAHRYDDEEPHFRPENRRKVRGRLERLAAEAPSSARLLDLGCGTGFILSLCHDLFGRLDGVDITREMLDRVDLSPGNIHIHEAPAEHLPFEDATFDAVTAYTFLDHLADHRTALVEAARVLKPGGLIYIDLVPNRAFWDAVGLAASAPGRPFGPIVEREIGELYQHEQKLQEKFGIAPEDWRLAELAKAGSRGFDARELAADMHAAGFDAEVSVDWYLGQAVAIHERPEGAAELIEEHHRSLRPTTDGLFKYLVVTGRRR